MRLRWGIWWRVFPPEHLLNSRVHERVHVEQFERWGFLFPLVYMLAGWWARWRGGSFYWDNPYEIEARARAAAAKASMDEHG